MTGACVRRGARSVVNGATLALGAVLGLVASSARADDATPPAASTAVPSVPPAAPIAGPDPTMAASATDPPARSVLFDLGAGTYFPLMVGAEATVELPHRILVQASAGWMPSPYSNTTIDLLGDFGALTSSEQTLIKDAIQNAFAGRLSLGWRPFAKLGLEALAGYTILTAGGSVSGTDVIDSFLQTSGSSDRYTAISSEGIPLRATLHNFHATVDWRFLLWSDKLVLRASVGYLQCFAASTTVTGTATRPIQAQIAAKLNSELAADLNPYFTEYVKAPLLGVSAAYRF